MMRRGHTPFGYRIEKGAAVIVPEQAEQIRKIYAGYLAGQGFIEAARNAGLTMQHSSVKRLLQNTHYLGDEFYPAIIDKKTFDAAEEERVKRSNYLNRDNRPKNSEEKVEIPVKFRMGMGQHVHSNPYEHAAYVYSLIESEV